MKKPNASCVSCGREMWTSYVGRVQPCCHPCRRVLTPEAKIALGVVRAQQSLTCEGCKRQFVGDANRRYCGVSCSNRANAAAASRNRTRARKADSYWRRCDRSMAAPGLSSRARSKLLAQWRKAGATCFFCESSPDTVDHLVPLARGGTNYEGNLVPCCRRCNSSKSDLLVIEWRLGKPHGQTVDRRPWLTDEMMRRHKERSAKPLKVTQLRFVDCDTCGYPVDDPAPSQKRHKGRCAREHTARLARTKYRLAHGIPDDPTEPTKPFRRYLEELSRAAA